MRTIQLLTCTAGALALASTASAQLLFGVAYLVDNNFYVDTTTGAATGPLWSTTPSAGLAADDASQVAYMSTTNAANSGDLYSWPYNDPNPPTMLGAVTDTASGFTLRLEGMVFSGGSLYVLNEFDTTTMAPEGIFRVDLTTMTATSVHLFASNTIDVGGLTIDPATGLFYCTNDSTAYTGGGSGIVSVDATSGTETLVSPYPAGETDIDGCAFAPNGSIFLLEDEPSPLHRYILASNSYDPAPLTNPYTGAGQTFSAGEWAPGFGNPTGTIGTNYCGPAVANSTGASAGISATGSAVAADNNLTLMAANMPNNAFGFFLTSLTQGNVPMPGGSQGTLCLGGSIGRYVGAGQIKNSGGTGSFDLTLDLTLTPTPMGFVSIAGGQTWNYQAWYRDAINGVATSNFSDGLTITYQ
ncbi:MAG: hypothetical protein R3F49_06505 [Planctomycetota bacterium]